VPVADRIDLVDVVVAHGFTWIRSRESGIRN
jgi:hypothetical protein